MSSNEINHIRDRKIRELVEAELQKNDIEFGRGKKVDNKKWIQALSKMKMPSGVPIKKVRITKPEKTIQPIRGGENRAFVKPGSTHHLCLFEWEENGKTIRDAVFTTMLDAAIRVKNKEPLVNRIHPEKPNAIFLMSLQRGEMVLVNIDGKEELLVFNTAPSTNKQLRFYNHTDARKSNERRIYRFSPSNFNGNKVSVDYLGCLRWAND